MHELDQGRPHYQHFRCPLTLAMTMLTGFVVAAIGISFTSASVFMAFCSF
jgi:hypothetical protein